MEDILKLIFNEFMNMINSDWNTTTHEKSLVLHLCVVMVINVFALFAHIFQKERP